MASHHALAARFLLAAAPLLFFSFLCFSLFSSSFTDLVIVYSKFYCVVSFPSNFLSAAPRPPPLSLAARIFGVKNFALSKGKNQAKKKNENFSGLRLRVEGEVNTHTTEHDESVRSQLKFPFWVS